MGKLILDSLEINNFKAFEHLCIEKLGRVNLIAGKNNVGKTCLLEALYLYASGAAPSVLRNILSARDESPPQEFNRSTSNPPAPDALVAFKSLGRLFHGDSPASSQISIGQMKPGNASIGLELRMLSSDDNKEQFESVIPIQALKPTSEPALGVLYRGQLDHVYSVPNVFKSSYPDHAALNHAYPYQFVNSSGYTVAPLLQLWDKIQLTDAELRLVEALRIIAPNVERVSIRGREDLFGPTPIVKLAGIDEPVPLRSLGDGMNRLFRIALALVNAKDGFLLIDKIENGFHYTVMPDVWRLILKIAKDLNVQVFATTHSWDCVEGFQEATAEGEQEDGMMMRLSRKKTGIVPVLYDRRRITLAKEHRIEVR